MVTAKSANTRKVKPAYKSPKIQKKSKNARFLLGNRKIFPLIGNVENKNNAEYQ